MAFRFTTFYVGGVLCIWLSSRVSCQDATPCASTEGANCYLKYTEEKLREALGPDLRSEKLCSSLPPTSPCQDDCSMNEDEEKRSEEAYAAQRNIFCTEDNFKAYIDAATCFDHEFDFKDCIRQVSGTAMDSTANTGYDCMIGAKRLMCLDQHTPVCSKYNTAIVRKTYLNSLLLAGCPDYAIPMPQPSASEMDINHMNSTDQSKYKGLVSASASELVASTQNNVVSLLAFGALTLYRRFTNSG